MTASTQEEKATLRKHMQAQVQRLSTESKKEEAHAVCMGLLEHVKVMQAKALTVYLADESEVALDEVIRIKKEVVVPRYFGEKNMTFCHIRSLKDCVKNSHGIWEPNESCREVDAEKIEVCLVPGRAFTLSGKRLGRGGGYYDTFLSKHHPHTIGVCFNCQIVDDIPVQNHDQKVQELIAARLIK